jgi:hypothetical protein
VIRLGGLEKMATPKYTPAATAIALVAWLLIPAFALLEGWCIYVLWGWFVVPNGLPGIGVGTACGIGLLAGIVQYTPYRPDRDYTGPEMFGELTVKMVLRPLLFLVIGAIIHAMKL